MKLFKSITFLLGTICILSLGLVVGLFIIGEAEKDKRIIAEKRLEEIIREKKDLEENLQQVQSAKQMVQKSLSEIKLKVDELVKNFEQERLTSDALRARLEGREKITRKLIDKLEYERIGKLELLKRLTESEQEQKRLSEQLVKLQETKEELEKKLEHALNRIQVELERVVVRPKAELPPQVLVVNREFNFIIVNLGKGEVEVGMILEIYRADELLAKTRVERVYQNMCSATIIPDTERVNIRKKDRVRVIE